MANQSFGGQMLLTLGDGRRVKVKGDFKRAATNVTVASEKNLDGSHARVLTLRNYKCEMTLELERSVTAQDLILYEGNLTIVEAHTGRTHLFSDGGFTGEPETDQMTGKTTGLSFESNDYRQV